MNEHPETPSGPRLLNLVRDAIRLRHYSYCTEQSFVAWIHRFIRFHGKRHPQPMGAPEIREFLPRLAVHRNITPSTQNQALSDPLFLYRHVLHKEIEWVDSFKGAKQGSRLLVVLSRDEVQRVLALTDRRHVHNRGGRAVRSPLDIHERRLRYAA